jgi:hypothetical protein
VLAQFAPELIVDGMRVAGNAFRQSQRRFFLFP